MKPAKLKILCLLLTLIMIFSLLPSGTLFALAEEPAEALSSVSLSLQLPVPGPTGVDAGSSVPASVSGEGSGYSVEEAFWFAADGSIPESFEAGQDYFAEILLAPEAGYCFPEDVQVLVDSAAVATAQLEEDGRLRIRTEPVVLKEEEPGPVLYPLWVGGIRVSEDNKNDILSDGGKARFDPEAETLTLDLPQIAGTEEKSGAQILAEDLDLKILGKAELTLPDAPAGILVRRASLTLEGNFTVQGSAIGVEAEKAICFSEGEIGVAVSGADRFAVRSGENIVVIKAELSVEGTRCGIFAGDGFVLAEGVVKVSASGLDCDEELFKAGLQAGGAVEVKGGELTAKGIDCGLCCEKDLLISGGTVSAESSGCGILSRSGKLEALDGARRISAKGGSGFPAIQAEEIVLSEILAIREPEGGSVSEDKKQIAGEDGSTPVGQVLIESTAPLSFTVRFDTYGGPEVPSQTVTEGEKALAPTDPELEGFRFCGWFLDPAEDGEHPFDFDTPITGDLVLKALWACNVSAYVKDTAGNPDVGGTVSLGTEDYQVSRSASFWRNGGPYQVDCRPDEGYSFDHWEDGQGNVLSETGTSVSFSVLDGTKTFVAVFKKDPLPPRTVTLDADGGTPDAQILLSNEEGKLNADELQAASEALTKEGYDLLGWSLTPHGKPLDLSAYVFTEDTILYALWTPRYYTVRFEANGGSETPSQSVMYGKCAFEPDDPIKANYSFNGWYSDEGLTQAFDFSTPITADTVLYANWEQLAKYTVVSGGGSIYGKTSGKELEITVRRTPKDADCFKHFTGVQVDNGDLTPDVDYTAREGSTIVTLKPAFLSKLNSGSHIITILFDDGKATTGLTVKAGNSGSGSKQGGGGSGGGNPQTGDPGSSSLWTAVLLFSCTALGTAALTFRKLRRAERR